MEPLSALGPEHLQQVVRAFRDALRTCQPVLNRLNVYPVPDGDTGTNMAGTIGSVVGELEASAPEGSSMEQVCKAVSHGSLMGARGNSGIILCQVLRGLSEVVREHDELDAAVLAAALAKASEQADGAVAKPIEGTILSVVRASKTAAAEAAGADLVGVLEAARTGAVEALARTPEQLPVLAQAGVVDAGGAGYCLLLDAFLHVVDGRPLPDVPPAPEWALEAVAGGQAGLDLHEGASGALGAAGGEGDGHGEKDVSELRYEVMYLLEAEDALIPAFKEVWTTIGDSIVVVGGDGLYSCHIHCDDIGAAIEAALDAGRPRRIKVTDLLEQVEEERWVREGMGLPPEEEVAEPVTCGVVAVAVGEGVRRILRSMKVQRVVTGGQTMNPSTAELLAAVEAVPADQVVLLPNNKNIIPVARAVAELTTKTVEVVPTCGVAEGFAALLEYDPEAGAVENAKRMAEAADRVVAGEITRAVRATESEAGHIDAGDWLGIGPDGIASVDPALGACATKLLDALVGDDHEIVTLIEGEGATAGETRRITEWLHEHRPDVSVEVVQGGQPLYPYLLSVE